MGWLYMRSLGIHAGPREYLDAQFTFETAEKRCRVLRSALVRLRTYYAAVERMRADGDRQVAAIICLVRYNPNDREGYVFGYKDMDEGMGPVESECQAAILGLLTPTEAPYAVEWRARCRARAAERRQSGRRPRPRPGQTVVIEEPVAFRDGRRLDRLVVAEHPRSARSVLFRDLEGRGLYRVAMVASRSYRVMG
ncbi:DUF6927 domain-containing protein [uncultured Enterovirga sp.]|uniref:DUF6927 domain-containing protein n=1 Tax=uncultured Enterovirga sp. TaxID=2026352 RepID=UPI0035CAE232